MLLVELHQSIFILETQKMAMTIIRGFKKEYYAKNSQLQLLNDRPNWFKEKKLKNKYKTINFIYA